MYGLALGVTNINESLPRTTYAILLGLKAATVDIVALAAVQLFKKVMTDRSTRIIVFLGTAAGLMYNALEYFPFLMMPASVAAVMHDFRWLHEPVKSVIGFGQKVDRVPRRRREAGRTDTGRTRGLSWRIGGTVTLRESRLLGHQEQDIPKTPTA